MRFRLAWLVLVLLLVPGLASADDVPSSSPSASSATVRAARFAELARKGDKARAAGRLSEAVEAYSDALQIREDARIRGRLGLIALEGGAIAEAVQHLFLAFIDGHDIPPSERRQIVAAFERARPQVCRLDVTVSHLGAEVWIDGELEPASIGRNDFYAFVKPGRHEIRARLSGFKDAVVMIDAPKGGRETVPLLELQPIPPPSPPPSSASSPPASASSVPPSAPSMPVAASSPPSRPAASSSAPSTSAANSPNSQMGPRWSVGAGGVLVLGAVSQLPASGFVVSVDREVARPVSVRLDARAAWSPFDIEGWPIRGVTVGVLPALCVTRSLFFGCFLGHLGGIGHETNTIRTPPSSAWRFRGGVGTSAGIELHAWGPFRIRLTADVVILRDRTPLRSGTLNEIWSGPSVMGGFSLATVWRSGT